MNGVDFASPSETLAPRPQPRSRPRTLALLSHAVTRAASPSSVSPLLACAVAPSPLHPPPLIVTPPTAPRSIQPPRGRRGSRRAVTTLFSRLISKPPPPPPSSSPYPRWAADPVWGPWESVFLASPPVVPVIGSHLRAAPMGLLAAESAPLKGGARKPKPAPPPSSLPLNPTTAHPSFSTLFLSLSTLMPDPALGPPDLVRRGHRSVGAWRAAARARQWWRRLWHDDDGDKAQRQRQQQWLGLSCFLCSSLCIFFSVLFFCKKGNPTVKAIFCSM